jgi:hypothetical protein
MGARQDVHGWRHADRQPLYAPALGPKQGLLDRRSELAGPSVILVYFAIPVTPCSLRDGRTPVTIEFAEVPDLVGARLSAKIDEIAEQ